MVSIMKTLRDPQDLPLFEPKMTRSRLKTVQQGKPPQFVDIDLEEDEDSSDEEYCPDEDEETLLSPPRMHLASQHNAPLKQKTQSDLQGRSLSEKWSFMEKLDAVESEMDRSLNYEQPGDRRSEGDDDDDEGCLALRTRSRLHLEDVPLGQLEAELVSDDITDVCEGTFDQEDDRQWMLWLQSLLHPDCQDELDEEDDPEYDFVEDLTEPDLEDYRTDRGVQITRREVNKLLEELFDTSLNETTKNKQLDVHVRFWDEGQVQSRYLGSQFMGHSTAQDLLSHLKECMDKLDLRHLVSISMDGPSVNWKLFDIFQKDQSEQYGGVQLICVGSCGLHTLHNAFKCGFSAWQLDKLLRAMHTLFHNVPARREDYITITKSSVFPLSFCAHRWVENLPVVERALAVWPSLLLYMEAVKTKRLSNPGTASYDTVAAAIKDPLILAKLQFYAALARTFTPFLKKYQTDNPVLPFLPKDLTELMMSLLRRFIKREVLHDITALQLTKLDVTDKTIWLSPQDISIGLGAESVLKSIKGAELRVLEFKRECMQGLCNIIRKVQDKSPLKYLTVRQLVCLDPSVMYREPERCRNHMKGLVQRFLQDKQLTDTSAGDVILQQFDSLLSLESRSEDFLSFPPMQKRLDVFLCSAMEPYPELWAFCKKLLILSHGQATVERGFSINKEVESDNLKEDTVVTRRLVCDYIIQHGGVTQVPLSKQLLASVARARTRYRIHLETNRKNKEAKDQALKRKEAEDCLQELKVKRRCIQEVSEGLGRDADRLAEEAEAKAGSKMADLITRSNILRRGHKEKLAEMALLDKEITAKSAELRG